MEIHLQIQGLDKLKAAFRAMPRETVAGLNTAIDKSLTLVERDAKILAPVKTGYLRANWVHNFGNLTGTLYPTAKYALYVHEGTRPHVILPVNAKALYWKGAEHPVKSVNHPGTQGIPFLSGAVAKNLNAMNDIFKQEIDAIIKKVFK